MGLFSHSKQKDKLIKYLKEKNISVEENNSKLECAIQFKDKAFSLYPYFEIDEENNYFSIVINIKKIEKESSDLLFISYSILYWNESIRGIWTDLGLRRF